MPRPWRSTGAVCSTPRWREGREEPVNGHRFDTRPDGGECPLARSAAVHDEARHVVRPDGVSQAHERFGHRGRHRPRGFGLDEGERAIAGGDHQVDLEPLMISEVIDLLPATLIELVFDDLRRNEPLEERPEKWRLAELALGTDVEQMARKPGVDEVQFRRLRNLNCNFRILKPPACSRRWSSFIGSYEIAEPSSPTSPDGLDRPTPLRIG